MRELECPHCEETFDENEAEYTVCLTCGEIIEPGESFVDHDPDDDDEWHNQGRSRYSQEEAEKLSEEIKLKNEQ